MGLCLLATGELLPRPDEQVALLWSIFQQAPGFMALTRGREHRVILANDEFRRLSGRDPTGRTVAEALPELEAQGIVAMLDQVIASGEPFRTRNMHLRLQVRGSWEDRYVDFTSQPLTPPRVDDVDDVLCIGYDVTERHLSQQRVLKLQDEMSQLAQAAAMGTMTATLAHEMNQPLTAASSYLRSARKFAGADAGASEDLQSVLDRAEAQIQRAGEIIRRARRALSEAAPHAAPAGVAVMIDDVLAMLDASGTFAGVAIERKIEQDLPPLTVDRTQIEQVLANVVRNACEAMGAARDKRLTVCAQRIGDYLCIRVADTGCGFGAAQLDIEAFRSTTGGMGIGLSLSRTIVERHGGRILIANRAESGAEVTIELPIRSA